MRAALVLLVLALLATSSAIRHPGLHRLRLRQTAKDDDNPEVSTEVEAGDDGDYGNDGDSGDDGDGGDGGDESENTDDDGTDAEKTTPFNPFFNMFASACWGRIHYIGSAVSAKQLLDLKPGQKPLALQFYPKFLQMHPQEVVDLSDQHPVLERKLWCVDNLDGASDHCWRWKLATREWKNDEPPTKKEDAVELYYTGFPTRGPSGIILACGLKIKGTFSSKYRFTGAFHVPRIEE